MQARGRGFLAHERSLVWGTLALAHLAVAVLFLTDRASGTASSITGFPLDDSWIHLVYARSLARLDGFAYNPGVQETGFTSPLWVMLLAPAFWLERLGLPLVPLVKAIGVVLGWACSVLAFELVRALTRSRANAWCAALLVATDPWLVFARLSGMEVSLAAATVLFILWAVAEERLAAAAVGLALAGLARPENAVLVAITAPVLAVMAYRRAGLRGVALCLAPALLAALAWVGFCLAYTDRLLPNTFYAKHDPHDLLSVLMQLRQIGWMIEELPAFWGGVGLVLLLMGAARLLFPAAPTGPRRLGERCASALAVCYPVAFLAALAWTHTFVEGAFYWHRYFEPAIPMLLALLGAGMGTVIGRAAAALRPGSGARLARRAGAVAALGVCAVPWVQIPEQLQKRADLFSWNCQNIDEVQVALGHWVATHVPPGEPVAANDAGAIRFFGEHPVVDLVGLNDHTVSRGGWPAIFALRPTHYVMFPIFFPKLAAMQGMELVHVARSPEYTICDAPGQAVMLVLRPRPSLIAALAKMK